MSYRPGGKGSRHLPSSSSLFTLFLGVGCYGFNVWIGMGMGFEGGFWDFKYIFCNKFDYEQWEVAGAQQRGGERRAEGTGIALEE